MTEREECGLRMKCQPLLLIFLQNIQNYHLKCVELFMVFSCYLFIIPVFLHYNTLFWRCSYVCTWGLVDVFFFILSTFLLMLTTIPKKMFFFVIENKSKISVFMCASYRFIPGKKIH